MTSILGDSLHLDDGAVTGPLERERPRVLVATLLFALPFAVYGFLAQKWSLDGDEFYTLVDSAKPVSELLSYEIKPLYYLICHVLLGADLNAPLEFLLRAPAVVAASLIAPASYWLLASAGYERSGLFTALLLLANPLIFELSQFARFYSLVWLAAAVATVALYRWVDDRRVRWLVVFGIASLVATAAHSPAAALIPASVVGVAGAWLWRDAAGAKRWARRWAPLCLGLALVSAALGWWIIRDQFGLWLGSEQGQYGGYTAVQILVALVIHGGPPLWALAFLPLVKGPSRWQPSEVFLATTAICTVAPFLMLSAYGGGVSVRYALAALPAVFILAGRHWAQLDRAVPGLGLRVALVGGILAFYIPYIASTLSDGGHYDYRETARFVDSQLTDNTIVISSSPLMLSHYLQDSREIEHLSTFERGVPRERLARLIERAQAENRGLLVVSKEDRTMLSAKDQEWLYQRFALIRSYQSRRFDHRRFRMAVYEYRPANATENTRIAEGAK